MLTVCWRGPFAIIVSSVCLVTIIITGRLTELLLGSDRWRFADVALWVAFVWLAVYTAIKCYGRLVRLAGRARTVSRCVIRSARPFDTTHPL